MSIESPRTRSAASTGERSGHGATAPPTPASARPPDTVDAGAFGNRGFAASMFDSLSHSGFRWFFAAMMGQMASMNMQMLVRGYLVYLLTGSYADLGVVSFAGAGPMILFSLHGGVLADRVRRKKHVVMAGQFLSALNALWIAVLIVLGMLSYPALLIAAVIQGTIMALMMPARQAMIPEVVGMKRLMNAVALTSAGMNSMRMLAPALGGYLLALFSPSLVYFLMTAAYLWATVALIKVPSDPDPAFYEDQELIADDGHAPERGPSGILDGMRYIAHEPTVRLLLIVNVLLILMSMPYLFLLPGFVASVLHEGPAQLGLLLSLTGGGSLVGALVIAGMPPKRRGLLYLLTSLFQGVMLIAFSWSTWFWLTAVVMALMGIGQAGRQSYSNVLVQAYSDDEHRGRVMSVYMLQFGLTSLGTFLVGILSAIVGAQLALGGTAVLMVVIAIAVLVFSPRMRALD